jgi:cellulose synthase/poly-beta-1,6-N-acetylglucosamine synthase-like glycosyltransferase
MMAEIVFWCSVALVLYAYLGYPSALMALSLMRNRPVRKGRVSPRVSFIIAARNEEGRIREKIENTLRQDYPIERLEIIVASDCSTDTTDEIVGSYSTRVRLVRAPERRGKEAAQQLAVEAASGEILVFSDVATALAPDGISNIVENFADPTVGCVSSVDRFIDPDGTISGEGAYVRYEMFLRTLETRVNSLVGLSGSFFAARREVCRNWAADRQSDFNTLLNGVKIGLRGVVDLESAGYYKNIVDDRREFQRKVRTVVRGIYVLAANVRMLNPVRYGLFSWQLLSHKVCRWLVPFFMILACLSNAILISHSALYLAAFLMQLGFYAAALGGIWTGFRVLRIPSFLLLANLAILMAWFRYARGERITSWTPSERMRALPQTGSR